MFYESFDEPIEAAEAMETAEAAEQVNEARLSGFQNPSFLNNPMQQNLMPKIRFTTDAQEAEDAAKADRSDPFHLPDSVFYVEPKEKAEDAAKKNPLPFEHFQNDSLDIHVAPQAASDNAAAVSGDTYVGPSSASLDIKIEQATRDLTLAQEQLELAIINGSSVIIAMHRVDTAQKLLDSYVQLHSVAVMAEARQAANLAGTKMDENVRLGSVSHAQWELEKAYDSGNSIWIRNAEKNLAHEKAKGAAKD